MQKYKLITRDGGLAHEGEMAPFMMAPGVVMWGIRTFVYHKTDENHVWIFAETFAVFVA